MYSSNVSYYPGVCKMDEARDSKVDKKIEVVYEGGVFKLLGDVKLRDGTEACVVIKPRGILKAARRHRMKVE
jgi:predicted DNA-binding antitoxin AbrB/MazE fold protein